MNDIYKKDNKSVLLNLLEKILTELKNIVTILDKLLAQVKK